MTTASAISPHRPAVLRAAMLLLATLVAPSSLLAADARIGDLTVHEGDVPRRLVGYGLVVGLDGTGDRNFGGSTGGTPTVRSIVNLMRRFDIEVPASQIRPRDVAAVLVTAEVSPWLRAGGRFEVQVSAMGDAGSLRGGVLWITPLVTDPGQAPEATAQGPIMVEGDGAARAFVVRRANSGRIASGGIMEVNPPAARTGTALLLRRPDLGTATRIAAAVSQAFGEGTARVDDAGRVTLTPDPARAGGVLDFLAAVDTLIIGTSEPARIVIDAREGSVIAGGDLRVGPAVVSHHGITLVIGSGPPAPSATSARGAPAGLISVSAGASVLEVVAGLHAAGARPEEVAAIFSSLEAVGALHARVVLR